jgi:hypothetical protein
LPVCSARKETGHQPQKHKALGQRSRHHRLIRSHRSSSAHETPAFYCTGARLLRLSRQKLHRHNLSRCGTKPLPPTHHFAYPPTRSKSHK